LDQMLAERETRLVVFTQEVTEKEQQIGTLAHRLGERDTQVAELTQAVTEKEQQLGTLAHRLGERDTQVAGLTQAVTEKEQQLGTLAHQLGERDTQVAELTQAVIDKDRQIGTLEHTIGEQEVQVAGLTQAVTEKEQQIGNLDQMLSVQAAQVAGLTHTVTEKEQQIGSLEQTLSEQATQVVGLTQAVTEKEQQLGTLEQRLGERDTQVAGLTQTVTGKEQQIGTLEHRLGERDTQVAGLTQTVTDKEQQIGALAHTIGEQEVQVAGLTQAVTEKEQQIGSLEQALGARDTQVTGLTQTVTDKDRHIGNLEQMLGERDTQVAELTQAVTEKDQHIGNLERMISEQAAQVLSFTEQMAVLNQSATQKEAMIQHLAASAAQFSDRLDRTRSSLGWKLLKPQRAVKGWIGRIGHRVEVHVIPFQQLKAEGAAWVATGQDPQFLVVAERAWHGLTGWYWLELTATSEQPLKARLCFDLGYGFDPRHVISFKLMGTGRQQVPLFVPAQCRAIRLDPCDTPARFSMTLLGLEKPQEPLELPQEFLAQSRTYEALGGKQANVPVLKPLNEIQRHDECDYDWSSKGEDPYFVVESIGQELQPGYYLIELHIRSNLSHGNAKGYFDFGKGFSESDSVLLPFVSGETVKRLYHLTAVPQRVRLDPFDCSAKFTIEHLKFTNVGLLAARQLMLEHLSNHSVQDKGEPTSYILEKLQKQASSATLGTEALLYERYNRTFKAIGLYADWIERVEAPEFSDQAMIEQAQISFTLRPTISVLVPVYNTDKIFLRKAIDSVLTQSYSNWELCVADDASRASHVRKVLEDYARRDPRIKVIFRAENGHISAASNSALELAAGDYVALLDHDDELAPHALHFVVDAINRNPDAQIIYSDEDKIDVEGNRSDPHFKSDWNPDLFFSQNYVSHLGVYRRDLLQRIGGFRKGLEGSQDYDLLLRCLPHVKPSEIVHVPRVLYHWRMVEGSTALASGEKSYTIEAGIKALWDFFSAQGQVDIRVEAGIVPNTYRLRYPIPQPEPLVSLLIPTRDTLEMLAPCIRSILKKTSYQNYEIIILDNESIESATLDYFEHIQAEDARVRVLPYPYPFNYSAINNYGVQHARGELIGLINNDIEVINPEWLTEMVSHALRPGIGCVGAKLYYADDTIQHAGVILGIGGVANHSHLNFPKVAHGYFARLSVVQNFSAVTAACLVVRKDIYKHVGGLDEVGLPVAFNDVDFCLKVREAGYRNLWTPYAELYHYESKSRGLDDTPEKVERFNGEVEFIKSKWGDRLRCDPYYNPNLSLGRMDFSIGESRWKQQ